MPSVPTSSRQTAVTGSPARRVVLTREGPLLMEGPVEIVLDDGSIVCSDRPVVALCLCRRSHRYPFCDTSHRKRVRATAEPTP